MSSTKNDKNEARIRKSGLDGIRIPDILVRQPDGRFHIPEPTTRVMDRSSTQDPEHDSRFTHLTPSAESPPSWSRNTLPAQFPTLAGEGSPPRNGVTRHQRSTFPGGHADKIQPRYTLRWELNKKGKQPGQLRKPTDLCFLDSENLVVSEGKNSRLQIFGRRHQVCIDRSVAPDLVHPTSVCPSSDGYMMLVADLNQVHYFNLCGEQEEVWPPDLGRRGSDEFINITAMGVDCADNLVLAEYRKECTVGIYSQETGQPIRQCKPRSGQTFGEPSYITCDQKHGISYVSDSIKGCVHCFDKHGRHISTFGNSPGRGHLICPLGMHLTAAGELFVADKGRHTVSAYSVPGGSHSTPGGELLHHAITQQDGLVDPVAVTASSRGSIAVAQHSMDFESDSYAVKVYKRTRVK